MKNSIDLAKYVVRYANKKGVAITHLQLQTILYYINGCFLGVFGEPAFYDDIEAWKYGPVVPYVYDYYRSYGYLPLIQREDVQLNYNDEEMRLLDYVIEMKMKLPARKLVGDTHMEKPWLLHKNEIDIKPFITQDEIKDYFMYSREVQEWKGMN